MKAWNFASLTFDWNKVSRLSVQIIVELWRRCSLHQRLVGPFNSIIHCETATWVNGPIYVAIKTQLLDLSDYSNDQEPNKKSSALSDNGSYWINTPRFIPNPPDVFANVHLIIWFISYSFISAHSAAAKSTRSLFWSEEQTHFMLKRKSSTSLRPCSTKQADRPSKFESSYPCSLKEIR